MTNYKNKPASVSERVEKLRQQIGAGITQTNNRRLNDLWGGWETQFRRILEESKQRPEVAVSLVGSTGAGKSTLLNALLDARLLPVSNMRACTAAISEVSYLEGNQYAAEIEFVPRDSWQREIDILLGDIKDATNGAAPTDHNDTSSDTEVEISRVARTKLWTVYRPSEDADPREFDPQHLVEPPEIAVALNAGIETFSCSEIEEFRKRVSIYLDSKHRYWPVVKSVKIKGPFKTLQSGAKLIDLPGLNDPNEAREEVTKTHLKTSRFVWIVFNIKRLLTRDTVNLMVSDDFLRQVVMDGRAGALTLVGTAADDIDPESGREEFNLDEDASEADVVLARNKAVQKEVTRQLEELSFRLAKMAGENESRAKVLANTFKHSRTFAVSAREYLRLTGLAKTRPGPLEELEHTELPALRLHMNQICAGYGVEAQAEAHHRQMDLLLSEIRREIYSQRILLEQQTEITQTQRKEMEEAADAARSFLRTRLQDVQERFVQDLDSAQELLRERLRRATERAHGELDLVITQWSRMHWGTLRAVARRGGSYVGSTGKHDFPGDLTKPIFDGITFAWSDFFGDKLNQMLEKWTERLRLLSDDHRKNFLEKVGPAAANQNLQRDLKKIMDTTEKVLTELMSQTKTEMEQKIETVRRSLYECIPIQVRTNMQGAFDQAAQVSGQGTKTRMVEVLSRRAKEVSGVMFDDAQTEITQGVRSLNSCLACKYAEMGAAVDRHAGIASENIKLVGMSLAEINEQKEILQRIGDGIASLTAN